MRGAQFHVQLSQKGAGVYVQSNHGVVPDPTERPEKGENAHARPRRTTNSAQEDEVHHHGSFQQERQRPLILLIEHLSRLPHDERIPK